MKLTTALATMALALGFAGTVAAQSNSPNSPPPLVQTVPVVLGEVTGVTSHTVTVRTTRGETMGFETDSRTVMPANLMTGRRVKIEFRLMGNGDHHAGRITVIEPGSKDWDRYDDELTMIPHMNEDMDQRASTGEDDTRHAANVTTGSNRTNATHGSKDDAVAENRLSDESRADDAVAGTNADNRDELPRTASRQPLLLGAGLAALALGLVVAFARRRRTV